MGPLALPEWMDPTDAELGGLLALAGALTVLLVAGAWAAAWLWHRLRDKPAG